MTNSEDSNRRLERLAFRARPSLETVEYDGWVLRFADGYTKRANSVNPHFGSTLPASTKISHCEALFKDRGLPTIFRLTPLTRISITRRSRPGIAHRQCAGTPLQILAHGPILDSRGSDALGRAAAARRGARTRVHGAGADADGARHRIQFSH